MNFWAILCIFGVILDIFGQIKQTLEEKCHFCLKYASKWQILHFIFGYQKMVIRYKFRIFEFRRFFSVLDKFWALSFGTFLQKKAWNGT